MANVSAKDREALLAERSELTAALLELVDAAKDLPAANEPGTDVWYAMRHARLAVGRLAAAKDPPLARRRTVPLTPARHRRVDSAQECREALLVAVGKWPGLTSAQLAVVVPSVAPLLEVPSLSKVQTQLSELARREAVIRRGEGGVKTPFRYYPKDEVG